MRDRKRIEPRDDLRALDRPLRVRVTGDRALRDQDLLRPRAAHDVAATGLEIRPQPIEQPPDDGGFRAPLLRRPTTPTGRLAMAILGWPPPFGLVAGAALAVLLRFLSLIFDWKLPAWRQQ